MTTTYHPSHPRYLDPDDLRQELDRVFDLCASCRLCLHHCPAFPTLFDAVDRHGGQASALEDAERARVVAECYGCKLCYLTCPYVPPHEWQLDFPRLMLRAQAVSHRGGGGPVGRRGLRRRLADQVLGRT
ncbi:MAG TPA: 4Fe-4S dicluster domain-containing protein, partial [Acidimicrobiales bacterium]|nr:4Fe-4S dicluster domain-containing protein [Acidimicrobiales bacterium]